MLLQSALDKADEAQKEMQSIPEAATLQEHRAGAGALHRLIMLSPVSPWQHVNRFQIGQRLV